MSKSTFQHYYQYIIIPFHHRIKSLRLTNLFIFDFIFSSVHAIPKFIRLETLILKNIDSTYLEDILNYLAFLPYLSSLVIIAINFVQNKNYLYRQIFRLPQLKYCKIALQERVESQPLPIAINEYSSIEHLAIMTPVRIDECYRLLSYVPQLRRLFLHTLNGYDIERLEISPIVLNYLTHVFLNFLEFNFDEFESLVIKCFRQIQVLRIVTREYMSGHDIEFLNAKRWERLILTYMPYLHIFDIDHEGFISSQQQNQRIYIPAFEQFSSPFWLERKWFFTQHYVPVTNWTKARFFSSNPYRYIDLSVQCDMSILFVRFFFVFRRKRYVLYKGEKRTNCPNHDEFHLNSVHHLRIVAPISDCVNYFPNVTQLTLYINKYGFVSSDSFLASLTRILSLKQLTKLVIKHDFVLFKDVIELLRFMPNIDTFTIAFMSIEQGDYVSIQESENFQLVSNENIITNVTILKECAYEQIQLLINLFPRMHHLTIKMSVKDIKPITQLLLSRINDHTCRLFSLYIPEANAKQMELKNIIESEKLFDDCCIRMMDNALYLWR
jgi:hypothetical protein